MYSKANKLAEERYKRLILLIEEALPILRETEITVLCVKNPQMSEENLRLQKKFIEFNLRRNLAEARMFAQVAKKEELVRVFLELLKPEFCSVIPLFEYLHTKNRLGLFYFSLKKYTEAKICFIEIFTKTEEGFLKKLESVEIMPNITERFNNLYLCIQQELFNNMDNSSELESRKRLVEATRFKYGVIHSSINKGTQVITEENIKQLHNQTSSLRHSNKQAERVFASKMLICLQSVGIDFFKEAAKIATNSESQFQLSKSDKPKALKLIVNAVNLLNPNKFAAANIEIYQSAVILLLKMLHISYQKSKNNPKVKPYFSNALTHFKKLQRVVITEGDYIGKLSLVKAMVMLMHMLNGSQLPKSAAELLECSMGFFVKIEKEFSNQDLGCQATKIAEMYLHSKRNLVILIINITRTLGTFSPKINARIENILTQALKILKQPNCNGDIDEYCDYYFGERLGMLGYQYSKAQQYQKAIAFYTLATKYRKTSFNPDPRDEFNRKITADLEKKKVLKFYEREIKFCKEKLQGSKKTLPDGYVNELLSYMRVTRVDLVEANELLEESEFTM